MSIVVIRNRENPNGFPLKLSDDAPRRIRAHLKSAGVDVENIPLLVWPDDAVSAHKPHMYAPWQYITKSDLLRERREHMESRLWWKREQGVVRRVPLYVWVFWCPGINDFIFRGWWTYLIGLKGDYHGGGYKGDVTGDLFNQIKELFPVVDPTLFGVEEDWKEEERWMKEFAKRYQRGKWCGKPQGKAPIWCEVQGNDIVKILSRAEWPRVPSGTKVQKGGE